MQKWLFNATTVIVLAVGLTACSPPPASTPRDALPAGTAEVTINHRPLPVTTAVECTPIGSLTKITAGIPAAGISTQISNLEGLDVKFVSITDLGGFTGTYLHTLEGSVADVGMADQTYIIRGVAEGFDSGNPSKRTTSTFAIRVAC